MRELREIVEMLRSEDVLDDDVVGEAGEGFARDSRVSIAAPALSLARASFRTACRDRRHRGWVVRVVVRRGFLASKSV